MTGDHTARSRPLRPGDPRQLGPYELIGRLGEGGMGTVYLAQTAEGQHVAVKMIRSDLVDSAEFRRRFRREVDRAREVPPFCTAEVLDADPDHPQPYLVVEYVDGPSLAAVVTERGPLTQANLHALAIGVATALTAIHGAGVIHRDLKPNNVLLAPGSPKVIDFGIARAVQSTTATTRVDQVIGTVAYMAPERFGASGSATLSPAADIFAWGAVIAYAGTGRSPFAAGSPHLMAARILTAEPDLTGLLQPLRDLVEHALAKDPAQRPTARELLDLLLTTGPSRSGALAAALARQPALLTAAEGAQAATDQRPLAETAPAPLGATPVAQAVAGATTVRRGVPSKVAQRVERSARDPRPAVGLRAIVAVAALVAVGVVAGIAADLIPLPRTVAAGAPGSTHPTGSAAPATMPLDPSTVSSPQVAASDSLVDEALWHPTAEPSLHVTCSFSGALVVTKQTDGSYRCPGPRDTLTDVRVSVDVKLLTKGSCAGIWFRFDAAGYALRVCAEGYYLVTHGTGDGTAVLQLHAFPFATVLPTRTATRVSLTAKGSTITVFRDGQELGGWTDTTFTRGGRVRLGIFNENTVSPPPYSVSFANIEILAL